MTHLILPQLLKLLNNPTIKPQSTLLTVIK